LNLIWAVPLRSNSRGANRPTGRRRSSRMVAPWPAQWPHQTEGLHVLQCKVSRDLRLKTQRGSWRVLPKLKLDRDSCLRGLDGDFFFPKLDGAARLLPSSSGSVACTKRVQHILLSLVLSFNRSKRQRKIVHKDRSGLASSCELQMKIEANPVDIYRAFGTIS
jgi:hypothetical protein